MKFLAIVSLVVLVGCQAMSGHMTVQEGVKVVSLARGAAIASGVLSADEVQKINSSQPAMAYYFMARPYADYRIHWKLSEEEEIVVSGQGDLTRLENAAVARRAIQQPVPTYSTSSPQAHGSGI